MGSLPWIDQIQGGVHERDFVVHQRHFVDPDNPDTREHREHVDEGQVEEDTRKITFIDLNLAPGFNLS